MDKAELHTKIRNSVIREISGATGKRLVPAAVSGRHVHLCRADIDALYGEGYELTPLKPLSQPGQYAARETLTLVGPKGEIENIRVLGPARPDTQVEISVTDCYKLGIPPVVRMSGDLAGTPGGILQTKTGRVRLECGIAVAARHVHLSAQQAKDLGVTEGQALCMRSVGSRAVVYENVIVRSGEGHDFEVHLDTDEANAAGLKSGDVLEIV